LRGLAADEREERLAQELAAERGGRFELAAAPLLRVLLVRVGAERQADRQGARQDERPRLGPTHHHLLEDGGAGPVLVEELLRLIAAGGVDDALPPPAAYRDYLSYLARQDHAASLSYWREALAGIETPTRVAPAATGSAAAAVPEQVTVTL